VMAERSTQVLGESTTPGSVLADTTAEESPANYIFSINVPAQFADTTTFSGLATFLQDISAPNIIYSLTAGKGISISLGQTPTLTNTGVTSLQTKTGDLTLSAGDGISIDGLKISNSGIRSLSAGGGISVSGNEVTNSDTGSSQSIFKTISVSGQSDVVTDTNGDTLTFAGSGVTITTDATNDKITFTAVEPNYALSGWTDNGTSVGLTTTTDSVVVDTLTFGNATITNGESFLPDTDLGSDLGSTTKRFNNLWVANINSNSSQAFSGQTTFSYAPTDTTISQGSVIINPTTSAANGQLLGLAIAGYQKALIDEDGDIILGYSDATSAPATDYPLNIYGHSGTRVSYIDTSGNFYMGTGLSSSGALTITPLAGQNLNVALSTTGDFAVNTDDLYVDTSTGRVGIGTTEPSKMLTVNGEAIIGDSQWNQALTVNGKLTINGDGLINSNISVAGGTLSMGGGSSSNYAYLVNSIASSTVPVFVFRNDLNTGLGSAGSDIASLIAGGTNILNVTTTGVGIGTTAPTSKLHVSGAVTGKALAIFDETGNQNILVASASGSTKLTLDRSGNLTAYGTVQAGTASNYIYMSTGGIGTQGNTNPWSINYTNGSSNGASITLGSTAYGLDFYGGGYNSGGDVSVWTWTGNPTDSTHAERLTIKASTGNVGIGTTAPTGKLHVSGAVTGKALAIFDETGNQNILVASASGTPKLVIDRTGKMTIGGTDTTYNTLNLAAAATPRIGFSVPGGNDAQGYFNYIQRSTDGQTMRYNAGFNAGAGYGHIFSIDNGSEMMRIEANSRVGIKDSSPDGTLEVVKFSTDPLLMISSAAANDGDYLYIGNTGLVGIGTTAPGAPLEVVGTQVNIYNNSTNHGRLYIGNSNATAADNLGGYLYIGKFNAVPGSDNPLGAVYFYAKTTDSVTHVAGFQSTVVTGSTTRSLMTGNFDIMTKPSGVDDPVTRIRIDQNGLIGIGTTSPTQLLSLDGTAARTIWMERNTTAATAGQGLTLSSGGAISGTADLAGGDLTLKSGISTGTGTSALHLYTATAGSTGTSDNTPTEKMTILGSGNVGIGTTNPGYKLEVVGTSHFSGALTLNNTLYLNDSFTSSNYISNNTQVTTYASGYNKSSTYGHRFLIDGSEYFRIGTNEYPDDQTRARIILSNDSDTYWINPAANTFAWVTGGTERLRIDSSGNVGIGTTAPTSKLHVTGAVTGKALAIFDQTGDQNILTASSSGVTKFTIGNDGTVTTTLGTGTVYSNSGVLTNTDPSDINLKKDVLSLGDDTLDKVLGLRPVSYNWKSTGDGALGFIAQEVRDVFPELVGSNNDGTLGLYTTQLIPVLAKAIQEQQLLIDEIALSSRSAAISESQWNSLSDLANSLSVAIENLKDRIMAIETRLTEMADKLFAKEATFTTLCVGDVNNKTCLTKEQVDRVIQSLPATPSATLTAPQLDGQTTPTSEVSPTPTSTPTPIPETTPVASESAQTL